MLVTEERLVRDQIFKITEFSVDESEAYVEKTRAMVNRGASAREWYALECETIASQVAGLSDTKEFRKNYGKKTMDALQDAILDISGLKLPNPGEAVAASTSPSSEAA